MKRYLAALGACAFAFVLACNHADEGTSAHVVLDGGVEVTTGNVSLYMVRSPYQDGAHALVGGVQIDRDQYIGVGIDASDDDASGDVAVRKAFVFFQQGAQRVEGTCSANFSRTADQLDIHVDDCSIGEGHDAHRLALSIAQAGEVPAISVEESVSVLPEFAAFAKQVQYLYGAAKQVPVNGEDLTAQSPGYSTLSCGSCQVTCESYRTGCLLYAFSCGPFYAICAGVCYYQYGDCYAGCGC